MVNQFRFSGKSYKPLKAHIKAHFTGKSHKVGCYTGKYFIGTQIIRSIFYQVHFNIKLVGYWFKAYKTLNGLIPGNNQFIQLSSRLSKFLFPVKKPAIFLMDFPDFIN